MSKPKTEKEVAKEMDAKGYRFVAIPLNGDDNRNLYGKTPLLLGEMVQEFPATKFKIMSMETYLGKV